MQPNYSYGGPGAQQMYGGGQGQQPGSQYNLLSSQFNQMGMGQNAFGQPIDEQRNAPMI